MIMKQAAMYVRVSTNQQKEEETIESQKAILLTFARSKGFEIPDKFIFEDNGVSGATLIRPALDNLRDYASEGLFDHLFVLSPDRLSRKYAYQVLLMEELKKYNVQILFRNSSNQDTPEETMLLQMQGMFAEYERAQINERTRRGKKYKAKKGLVNVLSKASYGYRYIRATLDSQAYLEVHDKEAGVVRLIFDLYVKERLSIGKIKMQLESLSIASPTGNNFWHRSTISDILRNSSYKGIAYYGKTEKCEPNQTRLMGRQSRIMGRMKAKRGSRIRKKTEWIGIPVPIIVNEDIFNCAQELLKKNIKLSPRNTKEPSLLQGLLSCKECGYCFVKVMSGKKSDGYYYYACSNKGRKCNNPRLKIKDLDEAVWNSFMSMIKSPELIKDEISSRLSELKNEPFQLKQKQLEKKLNDLENEINRLLDAFQAGYIQLEELGKRSSSVKREMNNVKREIEQTNPGLSREQLLELTEAIGHFSKHLETKGMHLDINEKKRMLRMMIREIQVSREGIEINHIIPSDIFSPTQIAHLCTGRGDIG